MNEREGVEGDPPSARLEGAVNSIVRDPEANAF